MEDRRYKLTIAICNKLPGPVNSKSKAIEYTDLSVPRLKFSVSFSGKKTWYWRYQFQGKKKVLRIGDFPGISPDQARKKAHEFGAVLDLGYDPQQQLQAQREVPYFDTFARDQYLPYVSQRKRSADGDETKLRLYLLPEFGRFKLTAINRYGIETYLAKIAVRLSPASSNRHLALLSYLFNLAMNWDVVEKNPCAGIKKLPETNQIDRNFTTQEIEALRKAWAQDTNQQAAVALELLLFTGLRLREVIHARWENVDLEGGRLFLPQTKSGKSRHVVLNDIALEILASISHVDDSPWVFPGKDPTKPIHNLQKPWKRAIKAAGIPNARIHDLRHHFATLAVTAGVSLYNVQGLLGHANASTTQRYAHHKDDTLRNASQQAINQLGV